MKKIILFSLFLSTTTFASIPDLFGGFQRGAEQARQDNHRDAIQYYELERARIDNERQNYEYIKQQEEYDRIRALETQPSISFGVYEVSGWNKKDNNVISLRNNERLCWVAFNLSNNPHSVRETFLTPSSEKFGGSVTLTTLNSHSYRETERIVHFERHVDITTDNQIENCWNLVPEVDTGAYRFQLKIDDYLFKPISFYIID